MRNLISYCLFGTHRRYWHSVPFVVSANSIMNPDLRMRFHVHKSYRETPGYALLSVLAAEEFVDLVESGVDFPGSSAMILRMMPLFDPEVDVFFLRDIDASPCTEDVRAMRIFLKTNLWVHAGRGHWAHTLPIMGCLAGFRASVLRNEMRMGSFDEFVETAFGILPYIGHKEWVWNSDQEVLTRMMEPFTVRTLDTPMGPAPVLEWYKAVRFSPDLYKLEDVSGIPVEVREACDSISKEPGIPTVIPDALLRRSIWWEGPVQKRIRKFMEDHPKLDREWVWR
jgi:hypothetical protein